MTLLSSDHQPHLRIFKRTEFFFSPEMSCPIDGCPPNLVFPTKAKYQRHWTEKHLPEVVSYSSPVFHYKVSCRRRYDIKVHLLRDHNTAKGLVESTLSKTQRNSRPNGSFINPGMFTFYGRSSSTADKDVPPMPLVPESLTVSSSPPDAPVEIPCLDPLELEPPAKRGRVLTVQEYLSRDRSGCPVLPLDVSTQTRCQDLPPFAFSGVPERQEDIVAYIQWLEGLSFSVQHGRRRWRRRSLIRTVMSNTPDLLAEREKRRNLEAENLRLRKELADLKAVHLLFPEL